MRKGLFAPVAALAAVLALALGACTDDEPDAGGQPVIAPGKPGEENRTLSPEEAKTPCPA